MRSRRKFERGSTKRTRFVTIMLLALVAHAVFIGVVHHHAIASDFGGSRLVNAWDQQQSPGNDPDSTGDSQCVSCHLQRTNVSDNRPASLVVDLLPQNIVRETNLSLISSRGPVLLLSNRAPPLV